MEMHSSFLKGKRAKCKYLIISSEVGKMFEIKWKANILLSTISITCSLDQNISLSPNF